MSHNPASSQAERYKATRRQKSPDGKWYLSPREFSRVTSTSPETRRYWRDNGIPILDGEAADLMEFPDGNGMMTDYWSEGQAKRIIAARSVRPRSVAAAAKRLRVSARRARTLAAAADGQIVPAFVKGRTIRKYDVAPAAFRRELRNWKKRKKAKGITDPISVDEAATIAGVHCGTVNKWIAAGKVRYEDIGHVDQGGSRFVVSRREVRKFAARQSVVRSSGADARWLFRRQIPFNYSLVPFDTLRYYCKHDVPPLGRPIKTRLIDRPPGLKCRHAKVRQFSARDVRELEKWLIARKLDSQEANQNATQNAPAARGAEARTTGRERSGRITEHEGHPTYTTGYTDEALRQQRELLTSILREMQAATARPALELTGFSDTERNILEAVGTTVMIGEKLLEAAGYPSTGYYRGVLSTLCKCGALRRRSDGYFRPDQRPDLI